MIGEDTPYVHMSLVFDVHVGKSEVHTNFAAKEKGLPLLAYLVGEFSQVTEAIFDSHQAGYEQRLERTEVHETCRTAGFPHVTVFSSFTFVHASIDRDASV